MVSDPRPPIRRRRSQSAEGVAKPKRPLVVTLLILLVLSYTILNWFGFIEALRHWDFLREIPLAVPLLYLGLQGAFWGLVGLVLIWGLWLGRTWAWYAAQIIAALYAIFYWLDRLLLADSSTIAQRWPFTVSLTLLCLVYIFVVLRPPRSRRFFKMYTETAR